MRIAAAQLRLEQGDVGDNLDRALGLARRAAREGAEVVALPEFFTSGIMIDEAMLSVPRRNREAGVLERLRAEAMASGISIAGSFLEAEGGDVYNAMVVARPDGGIFRHTKDLPTQFEAAYYAPGDAERTCGPFGLALCWEQLRWKTVGELGPDARVVLAGSCWWSLPIGTGNLELDAYNDALCASTPAAFARAAGLPVAHASLVGRIRTRRGLSGDEVVERRLVGATCLVDRDGSTLASVPGGDCDDLAVADVDLLPATPRPRAGHGFWIPEMRDEYLKAWESEGRLGRERYAGNRVLMTGA